jgi:hypothetical protein
VVGPLSRTVRSAPYRRLAYALPLALASTLGGCSDDGWPTNSEPNPTISITVSPTSVTLTPGPSRLDQVLAPSADLVVTLVRGGGFTGMVNVTVEGIPVGVTATPLAIPSGSASGTLSLDATPSASSGVHALTVRATGAGVADATATVSLTIEGG